MIVTLIKILSGIIVSITLFVLWQLHISRTIIQTSATTPGKETAYIVSYPGYHNSLVMNGEHGWKEFSYGDWDVYGRSFITLWTGFKSMGFPTQGALGFQKIQWDGNEIEMLSSLLGSLDIISIPVEGEKASELYKNLETHIEQRSSIGIYNSENNLFFVTHPHKYIAWHTCNNMLIEWLNALGLRTSGPGWAGNFVIKTMR